VLSETYQSLSFKKENGRSICGNLHRPQPSRAERAPSLLEGKEFGDYHAKKFLDSSFSFGSAFTHTQTTISLLFHWRTFEIFFPRDVFLSLVDSIRE
jgi:hypothetical protein